METKVCSECNKEKPLSEFHIAGSFGSKYRRKQCKNCRSDARKERRATDPEFRDNERKKRNEGYRRRRKNEFETVVSCYGGKCSVCGENRISALLLHHTSNKKEDRGPNTTYYRRIIEAGFPDYLELLCGTCHLIHHRKENFK